MDLARKLKARFVDSCESIKKVGKDDPRRVIHSLKVGLAITLVSIFYYYQPLYQNFGVSAMWAVMTVIVVFEFSVGATIGKGLNRGTATLFAGALGIGVHHLAILSGHIGQPILLGFFVFLHAAITTFMRFFPRIKARYDYGMLVFTLTFSLISVSGFRVDEILNLAHRRLSTILIGCSVTFLISTLICPVWAGQDLHNLVALNIQNLANFLLGFGDEYFKASDGEESGGDKSYLEAYKSILNSKNTEESLANWARWEPGHGRYRFRHPWDQYLQVSALSRQCAYQIHALHGYLNCHIKTSMEMKTVIKDECTKLSTESGIALMELSMAMKTMSQPSSAHETHFDNAKRSAKNLVSLLESNPWRSDNSCELLQLIPVVTVALILVDILSSIDQLADSVFQLSSKAKFKKSDVESADKSPSITVDSNHFFVNINDSAPDHSS